MPDEFSCWFHMTECLKDAEIRMAKHVFLPFPPSLDYYYQFGADDEHAGPDAGEPVSISYLPDERVFWIECEVDWDLCPCKARDACPCCVLTDEHLDWIRRGDWEIQEVRKGKDRQYDFAGMFGNPGPGATKLTPSVRGKKTRS